MGLFKKKEVPEVEIENPDVSEDKYDGFYFIPDYEDYEGNMKLAFFTFKDDFCLHGTSIHFCQSQTQQTFLFT